jgi:hypothetical protein
MKNDERSAILPGQISRHMKPQASILILILLLLSGCAALYTPRQPMPIADVVQLSKSKASPDEIIQRIRASGTTYQLRGSDFAKLKAQGAPDPVLDFLQQSFVNDMDLLTRYWVLGENLGGCSFCYPQPVDVDKLQSGYGVVPSTPPGYYQPGKPPGTPDWVPSPLSAAPGGRIAISDVQKMIRDGMPEPQIVERINSSRLDGIIASAGVFAIRTQPTAGLTGSQLARLHDEGASYAVLDALQSQFLSQFIEQERMRYLNWGHGPGSMS